MVNFSLDTDRDGVEVTWDNGGHSNVYRLGFKGAVDLKATKSVTMGYYYRDHLPMLSKSRNSIVTAITVLAIPRCTAMASRWI